MRDAIAFALLVAGVAIQLTACAGVVLMRRSLDRLHYVGATTAAVICVAAAVLVRESFSLIGNKALALAAFLAVTGPVLTHVTARVAHGVRSE
jgi:multisubunit Na+/H+ antiporter MnhG subunit